MKKVFIINLKDLRTGETKQLSIYAFKDYRTTVDELQHHLVAERYELMQKEYDKDTDMTEILKGFIEVYETKKGQMSETYNLKPVKIYNYNF